MDEPARDSFFWRKRHYDQLRFGAGLARLESLGTALEIVMERKLEAKNDFFYAFVMFAMFSVAVFNVAA